MFGGETLSNVWNSATSAAKSAATSIANGASYVGGKVADGASYVGGKVADGASYVGGKIVDGASYVGDKVVEGAQWTGDKIAQGAQWTADMAKEGTRRAVRGATDAIYTGLGTDAQTGYDVGKAVKGAYDKVKSVFTDKPPAQPCIDCAKKDIDHDGVLVGYKDGKCVPLTNKGQKITPDDVKNAKRNGYNPVNNGAEDPDNPKDASKNTSDATKACCSKCTAGKPPRTIFYVNGINTTHTTHCETLKQIGDMTCANVVGIYNATEGMPKDALQTGMDRSLVDQAAGGRTNLAHDGRNPAVDTLSDLLVQETRAGRPPEIMAHSQGGAITSLALYDANNTLKAGPPGTPNSLSGTKVTSFGAAAPSWVQGPNYTHYVHVNDFTPMNFGLGDHSSAAENGNGKVVTFSGEPGGPFTTDKAKLDKHFFASPTKYHGIDDQLYLKMYDQQSKGGSDTCSCGRK
ncbi:MAG TPA: hypothetical protein PK156_18515 [Polyangium sp.]|nr:hypothetical protein [Polyangium sp.]